ncbi:MAG: DNA repair protein RecN [Marinilabiliaceae bacterium]|nr:DNA repair protein RecN [Marinilabiliaceae bacterium]
MLKNLSISNYALIDEVSISFEKGFSVITGETGAGKSILLGALGLILGQRADLSVLMDVNQKCVVEGEFDIQGYNLEVWMRDNDLDYEPTTIIRREISSAGKSRAFINDTPVNLSLLKDFVSQLVDIHSQHQTLLLSENHYQLDVVDSVSNSNRLLKDYKAIFNSYNILSKQLADVEDKHKQQLSEVEFWTFQFNQLNEAKLVEDEQTELEHKLQKLTHAEEIKVNLVQSVSLLEGETGSVLDSLRDVKSCLDKISGFIDSGIEYVNRVESAYLDLKDLAHELDYKSNDIEHSPSEIGVVQDRLSLIYNLQQKHQVQSVQELIVVKQSLEDKLNEIENFEADVNKLKKELYDTQKKLQLASEQLTNIRKDSFVIIEQHIVDKLQQLGMPNAQFKINYCEKNTFGADGKDDIEFTFTANKSSQLLPISKVASGGEMSRLMLCIKSLISLTKNLPTLILDEIDTGISGEIAHQMSLIMDDMGKTGQLIAITHLPQIAAKGDRHYKVFKHDDDIKTTSRIEMLDKEQRVVEIAKMLSGSELSDAAIKNARELLN